MDPGFQYCVEVRATDRSFNTGHWSDRVCVARAFDDRELKVKTVAGDLRTDKRFFFHTVTKTERKNRVLKTHRAHLRQVGIVARRCGGCGTVLVYAGRPAHRHLVGEVSMHGPRKDRVLTLLPAFSYRRKPIFLVTSSHDKAFIDGVVVLHRT